MALISADSVQSEQALIAQFHYHHYQNRPNPFSEYPHLIDFEFMLINDTEMCW